MKLRWAVSWAAAAVAGMAPGAFAQTLDVQLAPSAAVACMTPPVAQRGEPEYPFAPWKRGEGGQVRVELIFTGATLAPEVKVLDSQGDDELVTAVKAHVKHFRVPCVADSEIPLRLRQNYVFQPDKRSISWTNPVDAADAARSKLLSCMAAVDGTKSPEYPMWARRVEAQGNVLARLRFTASDQPPKSTLYTGSATTRNLGDAVEEWIRKLRMPCLGHEAVESVVLFSFRMEGAPPLGFRPLDLRQFLGLVKGRDNLNAQFDTRTMGCPFDVALAYRQPHMPNKVGEPGEPLPERRAFLEWLSTLELNLNWRQQDAALGDTARIGIPCVTINLVPKDKALG